MREILPVPADNSSGRAVRGRMADLLAAAVDA
jgi:hypothetical protein